LIDFDKTARLILKDWNDGKLKYYTTPPFVADGQDNIMTID
jgi:ribosome biogenesis GTPase A